MAVTAKRFYGPDNPGTSAGTLFTVTSAHRYVITQIIISNVTDSPATITISVGTDATDTRIFSAVPIPGRSVLPFRCYIPMEASEIMQAFQGTASALNVTVSGLDET